MSDAKLAAKAATDPLLSSPIDPGTRIGHVHLKVADIDRSLAFYLGVLGFELMARIGDQAAFFSAGGYHHHFGINTWESRGGSPPPPGHNRALSHRDPLSEPRGARRRAPPADRRPHPPRRGERPRGQRGALSPRPRRQRPRALSRPPAGGVAEEARRLVHHVHQTAGSRGPAQGGRRLAVAALHPGGAHHHPPTASAIWPKSAYISREFATLRRP